MEQSIVLSGNSSSRPEPLEMLLDFKKSSSGEDGAAAEEVATGIGSDKVFEVVDLEVVVEESASVVEAGSVEDSGTCEDWIDLINCFCWTATEIGDGAALVAVVVAAGFPMTSVLDEEHSEGASEGLSHRKVPSLIPLQTSLWLVILPLRTKAITVGPGTSTVSVTSVPRLTI